MLNIKIKYFNKTMPKIEKIKQGDWIDLRVCDMKVNGDHFNFIENEEFYYNANDFIIFGTGIAVELPKGYEAHIVPRSSTFKKYGLIQCNHIGIIDNSYCGDNDEWKLPMFVLKEKSINKYDRIAQFRIVESMPHLNFIEVDQLDNNDRGGFGSSGNK